MSFYGCYFSFNGVSCSEYGLMIYDFGLKNSENSAPISTEIKIIEDRISRRYTPLHYGTITNSPLEFELTFGADVSAIEQNKNLDRWDIESISSWLTAHDSYRWFEISQPDMESFRYKCFVTDLKHVDIGNVPWGFTCKIVCDSPFAYLYPEIYKYIINGRNIVDLYNKSSFKGLYKPRLEIELSNGGNFSILNKTTGKNTQFSNIPSSIHKLYIDNENEIITSDTVDNSYQYFNFNFLHLVRGVNTLQITGNGTVSIMCEFPVSIGG